MIKSLSFSFIFMAFLLMNLAGCTDLFTVLEKPTVGAEVGSSDPYRLKALQFEDRQELQKSLFYWKIALRLSPGEDEIVKRIERLKTTVERKAREHFEKGVAYYKKNAAEEARREFLVALRYDPYHGEALDYLKNKLSGKYYWNYKVKKGDTLRSIAARVYQDPEKDFLIAYFTDFGVNKKPDPGAILRLPVLDSAVARALIDVEKEVIKAKDLLALQSYEKVLPIVEKILKSDPANKKARDLANISYFELGKQLSREERYLDSLKMFKKVESHYNDVDTLIAGMNILIKKKAEEHYRRGVKHFVNEELKKAIEEWEKSLEFNPEHQKAKENIDNAKNLLEKLSEVK